MKSAPAAPATGPPNGPAVDLTKPAEPRARIGRNELGRIDIEVRAVEKIAALAAIEVPDAGAGAGRLSRGWLRISTERLPKVRAEIDGGLVFLEIELSVRWPASVVRVTAAVRDHLFRQVEALVGLEVREVNIEVVDFISEAPVARVS